MVADAFQISSIDGPASYAVATGVTTPLLTLAQVRQDFTEFLMRAVNPTSLSSGHAGPFPQLPQS